jgi:hypothetical protein
MEMAFRRGREQELCSTGVVQRKLTVLAEPGVELSCRAVASLRNVNHVAMRGLCGT